jgi:hypothetical protein
MDGHLYPTIRPLNVHHMKVIIRELLPDARAQGLRRVDLETAAKAIDEQGGCQICDPAELRQLLLAKAIGFHVQNAQRRRRKLKD